MIEEKKNKNRLCKDKEPDSYLDYLLDFRLTYSCWRDAGFRLTHKNWVCFNNLVNISKYKKVIYLDFLTRLLMLKNYKEISKDSYVIPLKRKEKNSPDFLFNINGNYYTIKSVIVWDKVLSLSQIIEIYKKYEKTCDVIILVGDSSKYDFKADLKAKIKKIKNIKDKFLLIDLFYLNKKRSIFRNLKFSFRRLYKKSVFSKEERRRFSLRGSYIFKWDKCVLSERRIYYIFKNIGLFIYEYEIFLNQRSIKNSIKNFKLENKNNMAKTKKFKKFFNIEITPEHWEKYEKGSFS